MNRKLVIVVLVLTVSLIATLLSFFYMWNLSKLGLAKFSYGFPLSWFLESQIVYPESPVVTSIIWNYCKSLCVEEGFGTLPTVEISPEFPAKLTFFLRPR